MYLLQKFRFIIKSEWILKFYDLLEDVLKVLSSGWKCSSIAFYLTSEFSYLFYSGDTWIISIVLNFQSVETIYLFIYKSIVLFWFSKNYCLKFYCFGKLVFLPELSWTYCMK